MIIVYFRKYCRIFDNILTLLFLISQNEFILQNKPNNRNSVSNDIFDNDVLKMNPIHIMYPLSQQETVSVCHKNNNLHRKTIVQEKNDVQRNDYKAGVFFQTGLTHRS